MQGIYGIEEEHVSIFLQHEVNVSMIALSNICLKRLYHKITPVRELTLEDAITVTGLFVCSI